VREFAREFYLSKEWRRVRAYIVDRDVGLCVKCGAPGVIVHHKTPLSPANINDPEITLSEDNLELLCRECHALAHATDLPTDRMLTFDEEGNLVERELLS
jgi:5-methylcytosine-specific restriction endonuclease McrA